VREIVSPGLHYSYSFFAWFAVRVYGAPLGFHILKILIKHDWPDSLLATTKESGTRLQEFSQIASGKHEFLKI
jgi:hypothetical protein